jgi:hypothetical protein
LTDRPGCVDRVIIDVTVIDAIDVTPAASRAARARPVSPSTP